MSLKNFLAAALVSGCGAVSQVPVVVVPQAEGAGDLQDQSADFVDYQTNGIQADLSASRRAQKLRVYDALRKENDKLFNELRAQSQTTFGVVGRCAEAYVGLEAANVSSWNNTCGVLPAFVQMAKQDDPTSFMDKFKLDCEEKLLDEKGEDGVNFLIRYYESEIIRLLQIEACAKTLEKLPIPHVDPKSVRAQIPSNMSGDMIFEIGRQYQRKQSKYGDDINKMVVPAVAHGGNSVDLYVKFNFCRDRVPEVSACFDAAKADWEKFKDQYKQEIYDCNQNPPEDFEHTEGACITWVGETKHPRLYQDISRQRLICAGMQTYCMEQSLEFLTKEKAVKK